MSNTEAHPESSASPNPTPPADRWGLVTQESVYGMVLVAGLILVAAAYESVSWEVFLHVIATVIVFWIAHVYASVIADAHFMNGRHDKLRPIIRRSFAHAFGLLLAAVVPCAVLILGITGALPDEDALLLALWACVGVLGVLGFVAFARRGFGVLGRLLGATLTAGLGMVLVIVKALVH